MTHEQLEIAEKLRDQIGELTQHINRIEKYLVSDEGWTEGAFTKVNIYRNAMGYGPNHPDLNNQFLPIPLDPKALLELYLTNARAALACLETEFYNL